MMQYMNDRIGSLSVGGTVDLHEPVNFCFADHTGNFIATVPMIRLIVYIQDLYSAVQPCDLASKFFSAHLQYAEDYWPQLYDKIKGDAFKDSLFNSPLCAEYIDSRIFITKDTKFAFPSPAVIRVNEMLKNLFHADVYVGDTFVQLETVQASHNPRHDSTLCLGPLGRLAHHTSPIAHFLLFS